MAETAHSIVLQSLLLALGIRAKAWNIRVLPLHWVRVGEGPPCVADICVVPLNLPLSEALRNAPLLCVEVVSSDDRLSTMNERVERYLDAGLKVVWIFDPRLRKAYQLVQGGGLGTATQLTVPGTEILVFTEEVFSDLLQLEPDAWRRSVFND